MPGVILYRDCKSRLDYYKRENPDTFTKHHLFVEVMKILEVYNFKLAARRDIMSMFTDSARLKSATSTVSPPSTTESNINGFSTKSETGNGNLLAVSIATPITKVTAPEQ
jgi:hypothetical protein